MLLGAYLIDLNAMVFGAPSSLFPALNHSVFGGRPSTLGLLYAAPGAGALLGGLTTGWLDRVRRQGIAIVVVVCVWAVAIVAFGLERTLWVALVLLAVAGWADVISAVLRTTVLQPVPAERFGAGSRRCRWRWSRAALVSAASSRAHSPRRSRRNSPSSAAASSLSAGR